MHACTACRRINSSNGSPSSEDQEKAEYTPSHRAADAQSGSTPQAHMGDRAGSCSLDKREENQQGDNIKLRLAVHAVFVVHGSLSLRLAIIYMLSLFIAFYLSILLSTSPFLSFFLSLSLSLHFYLTQMRAHLCRHKQHSINHKPVRPGVHMRLSRCTRRKTGVVHAPEPLLASCPWDSGIEGGWEEQIVSNMM